MSVAQILSVGVDARLQGVRREITSNSSKKVDCKKKKKRKQALTDWENMKVFPHMLDDNIKRKQYRNESE